MTPLRTSKQRVAMSAKTMNIDSVSTSGDKGINMKLKHERRELIRELATDKVPIKTIGRILHVSRNAVRNCIKNAEYAPLAKRTEAGIFLEAHKEAIKALYFACELSCPPLQRSIQETYQVAVPLRMLQRFCKPIKDEYKRQTKAYDVPMRYESGPGQQMQIDFGEKDVLVAGVPVRLHVFVAKLGYSRRIYAKTYYAETQEAWIDGIESAFHYFGGIPYAVVCDNAKSLVRDHYADTPVERFSERFYALSQYYRFEPIATKVRHPRSKGKVESGVKFVKANALVNKTYDSLEGWNEWLEQWCIAQDARRLTSVFNGAKTPKERFLLEAKKLRPLTRPRFNKAFTFTRKVGNDGLIRIENNHYRMDDQDVGKVVEIEMDRQILTVRYAGKVLRTLNKTADSFNPELQEMSTGRNKKIEINQDKDNAIAVNDPENYDAVIGWKKGGTA